MDPTMGILGLSAFALLLLALVFMGKASAATAAAVAAESRAATVESQADGRADLARKAAEVELQEELEKKRRRLEDEAEGARKRLEENERRLQARLDEVDRRGERAERREEDLGRREQKLQGREKKVETGHARLDELKEEAVVALERVAGLSRDEAREHLLTKIEAESRKVAARKVKEIEDELRERAEQTAKNVISMAIQRYAGEYTCERTVSVVPLPSEDLKGRIIGREGRNIRALEAATGVDFIVDDTPESIVISAYNPIRREVAKRALQTLLEDGRIHPSRIEQVVRKAETEFHRIIKSAGDEAANEVGISGIHPEILKLVGALKYRTSYGQNQWQHAIEVSFLSGMMAAELGLDQKRAKRAGLLHDIGKVLDQTAEGSHALIGGEFARRYGESKIVVNAIAAHHEEVPQETIYACLAQAADAISGARPGARRETTKNYSHRLSELERISNAFPGVERAYAVQAGREIRVLVENRRITDEEAVLLSRDIAHKIESEMTYPGQIKVTVIRETRVVQYAR
jgi:ribonuclease Y